MGTVMNQLNQIHALYKITQRIVFATALITCHHAILLMEEIVMETHLHGVFKMTITTMHSFWIRSLVMELAQTAMQMNILMKPVQLNYTGTAFAIVL